ncbi:MAG: GNAT family N-acetyltransferase [Candidatus Latescibacteria bacterium]|nr:GNAT family N-acetyltransferase [Candidatus Latescibacterota bacterium]
MSENAFTVRAAHTRDVRFIVELSREWECEGSTIGEAAGETGHYLQKLDKLCLVAVDLKDQHIGYLTAVRARPDYAIITQGHEVLEIEELYVTSRYRSSGVGTELLIQARQYAHEHDIHFLHVFSASRDIKRALSFYEKNGFAAWGFQAYADLRHQIQNRD